MRKPIIYFDNKIPDKEEKSQTFQELNISSYGHINEITINRYLCDSENLVNFGEFIPQKFLEVELLFNLEDWAISIDEESSEAKVLSELVKTNTPESEWKLYTKDLIFTLRCKIPSNNTEAQKEFLELDDRGVLTYRNIKGESKFGSWMKHMLEAPEGQAHMYFAKANGYKKEVLVMSHNPPPENYNSLEKVIVKINNYK